MATLDEEYPMRRHHCEPTKYYIMGSVTTHNIRGKIEPEDESTTNCTSATAGRRAAAAAATVD